ncbi:MAG: flagellar hook-basal body complex protein [Candidatus Sericytochromatia bacterium]|jgi:flagellar hook-basal body protein|nr:flagellar hook-basal body complex protein [Candidatus Sericytochromatia bacterium]
MGDVRISAKSSLIALNRAIEVISGNLTGASIYGYKGVRLSFADTLVNVLRSGTGSTGGSGGLNPIQVGTGGISVGATTTDFSQGSIVQTKNAGDIALQGNAFFSAVDAGGRITYTRNGEFHFDDQGNLTTNDGLFVLGVMDDLREVTQNGRLVDYDATINFAEATDPIGDAFANNRKGITMVFSGMGNIPMIDINQRTIRSTSTTNNNIGVLSFTLGKNESIASIAAGTSDAQVTLYSFLDLDRVDGLQDRIIPQTFISPGAIGSLSLSGGNTVAFTNATGIVLGTIIGPTSVANSTGEYPVTLRLTSTNNSFANTSLDNAKLIAQAINDLSDRTGIGASIIINQNKLDQAAIVLTHVQRALSTTITRLTTKVEQPPGQTNTNLFLSLANTGSGVLENVKDSRGNLFHRVNLKSLIGRSPRFVPQSGDRFQFDSTGQLINTSRGQDENSAPPFATGVHVAISKFANNDGLLKLRGSSQFQYSEASGDIIVGYAGQNKGKVIDTKRGVEGTGTSIVGTENTIIPSALEASNTSITEALPDLTIAQKSFTSNTKVVNVGNSIVDDLNGLIR